MRRLVYLSSARRDLVEILRYVARESGSADVARNFSERLKRQCERLAALPGIMGRARPELRADIRSFPCGSYVIFFRYQRDTLEIVNILEGHRDIDAYYRDKPS